MPRYRPLRGGNPGGRLKPKPTSSPFSTDPGGGSREPCQDDCCNDLDMCWEMSMPWLPLTCYTPYCPPQYQGNCPCCFCIPTGYGQGDNSWIPKGLPTPPTRTP